MTASRGRTIWIGMALVAACAALFFAWRGTRSGARSTALTTDEVSREAESAPSAAISDVPTVPSEMQRTAANLARGRVVTESGAPVVDALITFTALPLGAVQVDGAAATERDTFTRSSEHGSFTLEPRTAATSMERGVLWATAPGRAAGSRVVHAPSDWGARCEIVLAAATSIRVSVARSDGTVVAGATVEQHGLESVAASAAPYRALNGPRSAYTRRFVTDERGEVELPRFSGSQRIEARIDELRSLPFIGEPTDTLRLIVAPVFAVRGRVVATNATLPADTCIVAESARAGRRRELATRAVAADGTWSATALPADEVDEFVFRLVGSGLAPIEKSIVRPAPGASYTLDFECGVGFEAWVRAVRPSGEPVATATLYARWFDGSRFVELERTSDDSGTATLPIPKDVSVHFGARVAGFAAAEIGPFTFSEPASRTLTIELAPAGRIVGRCTHGATPVRDFEVVYWQGRPESRRSLRINDSIDGAFLIDDAPLGEVLLFAHSTTSPAGDTKSVQVTREQDAAVGLELGNGRRGHGFVIDATSGEPVTEATVQRITNLPDGTPLLRGAPEPVGTDGAFVVDGLPPQSTAVWIAASGYAPRVATTPADARVVADFGVIPLAHAQDLELRLIADAGFDFTQAGAQSADSPLLPLRRFEADGTLVYRNVPPRAVSVRIDTPSATEIFELRLVPGRLWRFELPFSGQRTCVVRTRWSDESARPQFVEATFRRTSGLTSRYAAVDSEGIARVDGIEGSELNLTAFAGEWRQLGSRSYRVPESGVGDVELACSNDALRVLVVDARGAAVVGARVSFLNDASSLGWAYVYYTDGSGECSLPGSTAEKLRIYAEARDHGLAGPIVVDPSVTRDAPVRITLSGLERLRVRLDDRGVACGGVDVRFVAEDGRLVTEATTDANGRVASQPVGEGRYSLDVEAPGYWPIHHALPAPRTTVETVVPLRRLGGIRFVVLAANGAVVPDSVIELQSREFEATVEQWISAGKLLAPQQGLRSDSNGAFVIDGLPNGDYVWRVTAPDGAQASGVTLVPPRARGEQTVLFAK